MKLTRTLRRIVTRTLQTTSRIMDAALLKSISVLERRKEELLREIDDVNEALDVQKAQYAKLLNNSAPIYKLPNELLIEIFITCQQSMRPSENKANATPFQVTMSHTSHRWRQAVLSTPLLWNNINFRVRPLNHAHNRVWSQLEAHLTRSDACLLNITLDFYITGDISPYLYLLARESRRWKRLSIVTRHAQLGDVQTLLRDAHAPCLEHLSLSLGRAPEPPLSPRTQYLNIHPSILPSSTSSLTFVRLAGLALGSLHPPMPSITTLHLDGWTRHFMSHEQFKIVLEAAASLVNLSLNQLCIHHPRDPLEILEPVTLPHLRCLRLVGPCSSVSHPLLLMIMPQLHSLSLLNVDSFDSDILPSVESLSIDSCALHDTDVTRLFHSLPSITFIRIDESLPDLFHLLLPNANQPTPWPRLEIISLRELQSQDVAPFCHMLLKVEETHEKLSKIYLDRRSRSVLRLKHKLDFIQEILELDVLNGDFEDPWPVGLGYEDPHDLLE